MSYIAGVDRKQGTFLPEYSEDYVSDENPIRLFDAFVNSLDMESCGFGRYTLRSRLQWSAWL